MTTTRTIRHPQPIEESKMQGYFMISKRDAAIAITNKLTGSQCRLWLYLMLIDPFADRTAGGEIKYHDLPPIPEIAIALGSSSDTVEKDLRKLRKLRLYEYRTVTIQGHNNTAANAKVEAERLKTKTEAKSRTEAKPKTETKARTETKTRTNYSPKPSEDKDPAYLSSDGDYLSSDGDYLSPDGDYLSPNGDYLSGNREPETLPDKQHSAPSKLSNLSKHIQTLSKDERESFLKFSKKKAASLPKPPELPFKWIEAHFEELREQWLETQNENTNQKHKYNFDKYTESQNQLWYGKLHYVVKSAVESDDDTSLRRFFIDDFYKCWFNWAKTARADVRELLANNPILEKNYG